MIRIVDEYGVLVEEGRLSLRERHAVAADVETPLRWIPFEAKVTSHTYIVLLARVESEASLTIRRSAASGASPLERPVRPR